MEGFCFIYVFDIKAKEKLSAAGLRLLRSDERNGCYIFEAPEADSAKFALNNVTYTLSNTLAF